MKRERVAAFAVRIERTCWWTSHGGGEKQLWAKNERERGWPSTARASRLKCRASLLAALKLWRPLDCRAFVSERKIETCEAE